MTAYSKMSHINTETKWQELTPGGVVFASGNMVELKTGDWATYTPKMMWDKCKQCLFCTPWCPDSSIPVVDGKRQDFDYEHCKGCGICAKVCPFKAIAFGEKE